MRSSSPTGTKQGRSVSPVRATSPKQRASSPAHGLILPIGPSAYGHFSHIDASKVKKNAKGGVLITQEELNAAFNLLDADKSGTISLQSLKKKLSVFFPEMSAKEYRFLMNNRKEMTIEDLQDLIVDNEITNFDPIHDAFKVFECRHHGHVTAERMREVFERCGFGELSTEELDILMRSADLDGDGSIGLEDFRAMVDLYRPLVHHKDEVDHSVNHSARSRPQGAKDPSKKDSTAKGRPSSPVQEHSDKDKGRRR